MASAFSRRRFVSGGAAFLSAARLCPAWSAAAVSKLPVPPLVDGTGGEPVNLVIRKGEWAFTPGLKTPALGFSQNYLGPTVRARRGGELNLHYHNTLAEGAAVHGHGLHVPGDADGGPQLEIAPGGRWRPSLSVAQPAATCWYHAHTHGVTGEQVYRGLAGMIIIDDDESAAMDLPSRYGVDDLPVIIQDRTFDARGRLVYSLADAGEDGWFGETAVINGAAAPVAARAPAGKVRLRLLNGANARFYIAAFADGRTFHKIASDGGFLEAPVPMTEMEIAPGERCEIIVDLSDGGGAELLTLFEDEFEEEEGIFTGLWSRLTGAGGRPPQPSLTLNVDRTLPANTAPLPRKLTAIIRPKESEITRTREFTLQMECAETGGDGASHGHAAADMTINGAAMDMNVINERVKRGVWERWRIRSDAGAHPFHVHGCSFLIDKTEGAEPPPDLRGWKDMVTADDDGWAEIFVRFDHPAPEQFPYMYHCHILEHEDCGMMGQFTVD